MTRPPMTLGTSAMANGGADDWTIRQSAQRVAYREGIPVAYRATRATVHSLKKRIARIDRIRRGLRIVARQAEDSG